MANRVYGPYYAKVVYIHDGDTIGLDIDRGFADFLLAINPITGEHQLACRLYQCFAPELNIQAGRDSLAYLRNILPVGAIVQITSHGWDKYGGRFDGVVVYNNVNINELMVSAGYATSTP